MLKLLNIMFTKQAIVTKKINVTYIIGYEKQKINDEIDKTKQLNKRKELILFIQFYPQRLYRLDLPKHLPQ